VRKPITFLVAQLLVAQTENVNRILVTQKEYFLDPAQLHRKKEFTEMVSALEKRGWKRIQIARRLSKNPGFISQACNPATPIAPSEATMKLFHMIVREEVPDLRGSVTYAPPKERVVTPDDPQVAESADQLRELHAKDPEKFQAAKVMIDSLYRAAPKRVSKEKRAELLAAASRQLARDKAAESARGNSPTGRASAGKAKRSAAGQNHNAN
jgi:hypothetical protein